MEFAPETFARRQVRFATFRMSILGAAPHEGFLASLGVRSLHGIWCASNLQDIPDLSEATEVADFLEDGARAEGSISNREKRRATSRLRRLELPKMRCCRTLSAMAGFWWRQCYSPVQV